MATTKNRKNQQETKRQQHTLKVPLKVLSKKGTNVTENKRKCKAKKDPFTLHLRNKFSFMKLLGLQFTLPYEIDNNNKIVLPKPGMKKCIQCYQCKSRFKSYKSYNIHLKNKHRSLLPYSCKICSKKFLSRNVLVKHRAKHQGRKPYTCSQCNMRFECLDALTAHVRRHLGKLPYVCKICKGGFDLHLDYKQHVRIHELKPSEKPMRKIFFCSDCDRQFRKLCDLERHTRVHTGERPFVCAVCSNRFQQAHNLTKHMVIHTQERRFQCEICLKQFGRNDVLTRHMLTHAVNKPFSCTVCDKTFARALQLTQHTTKHH